MKWFGEGCEFGYVIVFLCLFKVLFIIGVLLLVDGGFYF